MESFTVSSLGEKGQVVEVIEIVEVVDVVILVVQANHLPAIWPLASLSFPTAACETFPIAVVLLPVTRTFLRESGHSCTQPENFPKL